MTLSKLDYLNNERKLMTRQVELIDALLESSIEEANDDDSEQMCFREHEELVDAWRNGLSWFTNHNGGPALYETWKRYLNALKRAGYEGGSITEAFEEEGT